MEKSLASMFAGDDINLTDSMGLKPFWIEDEQNGESPHSILLSVFYWRVDEAALIEDLLFRIYSFFGQTCTLDAWWHNTTASSTSRAGDFGIILPGALDEQTRIHNNAPIPIRVEWAQILVELFMSYKPNNINFGNAVDFLSFVVSFGLSDITTEPKTLQFYPDSETAANDDWDYLDATQVTALESALKTGRLQVYDEVMTSTNWTKLDDLFFQKVKIQSAGHGHNLEGTTVRLSLAALLMYSAIATTYLVHTCISGRTSGSWDTIGELLLLGLNSKAPRFLGRTSAGVEKMNTYRQQVCVLVNEKDGLELVFDDDPDNDKKLYEAISPNTAY